MEKLGYNSELKEKAIKNSADLIKMHVKLIIKISYFLGIITWERTSYT